MFIVSVIEAMCPFLLSWGSHKSDYEENCLVGYLADVSEEPVTSV
jgi:hypothetical protein